MMNRTSYFCRSKTALCFLLTFCFIFLSSNAVAFEPQPEKIPTENVVLCEQTIKAVSSIPLFVTYVNDWNETADDIKELANANLRYEISQKKQARTSSVPVDYSSASYCPISIHRDLYEITELTGDEKLSAIKQPTFAHTFSRAAELVEQGITVSHINLFVPQSFNVTSGFDVSDPAAWEAACPALCPAGGSNVYNGYKFLYLESSLSVETTPSEPGNVGTFRWGMLVTKLFKLFCDVVVNDETYQNLSAASGSLSDFFGQYDPPYDVLYSSSRGYLKLWISGDLYTRTILISDNLDRVSGHAYYGWGTLERFRGRVKADSKWPTRQLPSGVYEYDTRAYTFSPINEMKTIGFDGNAALYTSVINFYRNTLGYFQHVEYLDLDGMFASLL